MMVLDTDVDDKVPDVGELGDVDVKINPEFYVHLCLVNAIKALNAEDIDSGFLKYNLFIETAEGICKGNNMLCDDYDERVGAFKGSGEYGGADSEVQSVKLANFKIRLIIESIGSLQPLTDKLSA